MLTRQLTTAAVAASFLLAAGLLTSPASKAGSAALIVPGGDFDLPQGSQISESRIEQIEEAVKEFRARLLREQQLQGAQPQQQDED